EYLNVHEHLYALVTNGLQLRLLRDSSRLVKLSYLEFDLERMFEEEHYADFALMFRLIHISRMPVKQDTGAECLFEKYHQDAIESGARIREGLSSAVETSIIQLATGFINNPLNEELRKDISEKRITDYQFYQNLLRLIYRLLFLMVTEERNLLFPEGADRRKRDIYYNHYSVTRLRALCEGRYQGESRNTDLWRSLKSAFRLFEEDGQGKELNIAPLGGALFHWNALGQLNHCELDNGTLLQCFRNLTLFWDSSSGQYIRVNYASLSVEEFGSVYEGLLDYHPMIERTGESWRFLLVSGMERKTTGSYYTPEDLVAECIKSSLVPVIEERLREATGKKNITELDDAQRKKAEAALLNMKVCDPACGSGHFLLGAARHLGRALAAVRSRGDEPSALDIKEAQREVISHCIYGVDKNPAAVELCRVALWIEGHAPGRPLSFLDHHIKCGDSLVGVLDIREICEKGIPDDAFKPVTGDDKKLASELKKYNKKFYPEVQTLFGGDSHDITALSREYGALETLGDDTIESVRKKEDLYKKITGSDGIWSREHTLCSLWTSAFFMPMTEKNKTNKNLISNDEFFRYLNHGDLHPAVLAAARAMALDMKFFHWPVEFPDVFAVEGFDCVLGNPPWETMQLSEKEFFATKSTEIASLDGAKRKQAIAKLVKDNPVLFKEFETAKYNSEAQNRFIRFSDRYKLTNTGKLNTYAVFAETMRSLMSKQGRLSVIVPTGIATDDTCKDFFGDIVNRKALVSLVDFENRRAIFPSVHRSYKFSLFTLSGSPIDKARFSFFLTDTGQMHDPERRFTLTPEEIALLNPNTLTCPVFRTRTDAELTKKIYRNVPVLVNEKTGDNPWDVTFKQGLFNMTSDSHLFKNESGSGLVPLYEAKMFHQYDHRWATYEDGADGVETRDVTPEEKADPEFVVRPRYWVEEQDINTRMEDKWNRQWFMCFRDITNATNERTFILSVVPKSGIGHTAPIIITKLNSLLNNCIIANTNSLILDYFTRLNVGGTHLTYFIIKQLPILLPAQYNDNNIQFITTRILELVYTAYDLKPFADDLWKDAGEDLRKEIMRRRDLTPAPPRPLPDGEGSDAETIGVLKNPPLAAAERGPGGEVFPFGPYPWDEDRRALLRAELDAYYAMLYGLTRDELRYILDPADVYGEDFPGETFRVLKNNEIRKYGEYRTQRLVLEAWDRLFG
ncbi:MAG TPA: N-6 DNA methylase, partial [Spirochaetota bacterium]|nr:N-6 DNA methylase [Spirochaetota bacterium]